MSVRLYGFCALVAYVGNTVTSATLECCGQLEGIVYSDCAPCLARETKLSLAKIVILGVNRRTCC